MPAPCVVADADGYPVTPELVVAAYQDRCFPMAENRDGRLRWYRPPTRAVIDWQHFRIPRSLAKRWRQEPFQLRWDTDIAAVIRACAQREETWISKDIEALYVNLGERGVVHAVSVHDGDGTLVGGLYGLAVRGVFCGESMFHRANDAAKLAVIALVALLRQAGYSLLDCQQQTPHMQRLGAYEMDDATYATWLERAPGPNDLPAPSILRPRANPALPQAVQAVALS